MIEHTLIISLVVLAIWFTMQPGEIFGFIGDWADTHVPDKLRKPLTECPICMTPYYGTLIYLLAFGFSTASDLILTIVAATGLNVIYSRFTHEVSSGTNGES